MADRITAEDAHDLLSNNERVVQDYRWSRVQEEIARAKERARRLELFVDARVQNIQRVGTP